MKESQITYAMGGYLDFSATFCVKESSPGSCVSNLNIPIHIHELRVAFLFASLNEKGSNVVCNKEETKRSNDVKRKSEHHGKRAGNSAKSVVFRGCVSKLNVS